MAKCSVKWNDSPQQLSTCSSSKRWDGDMGFICKGRGVLGGLVHCVERTAVLSGRKQGFRNASLSPLCLIIWMTSLCMTQRRLCRGCGVIRNDSPNDACHWSSKLTWGDGGMLKEREGKADIEGRGRDVKGNSDRCGERCCYFHPLC